VAEDAPPGGSGDAPDAPASYCEAARGHPFHGPYHDQEYGFPVHDDRALFERLLLEINQAGLSWLTILKKRDNFRNAYSDFDIDAVASYGEADRARLLADAGIVRNRLKVNAAIENAKRMVRLRASHGSFREWLDAHHPQDLDAWRKLFRATFVFTGGEIVREFLVSTGYLPGAHVPGCEAGDRARAAGPPWLRAS
jgi:DNA-3-methyladenine glycosylase I